MLQVLVHPEQVRVMPGRDDPDQIRPVIAVLPRPARVSPARRCGPEGSTDLATTALTSSGLALCRGDRPVQAGERRDGDRQQHLTAAGRPTSTATRS